MYSPDRVFLSDLKRLDPNLGCFFDTNMQRFVITYKRPVGAAVPLFVVKGECDEFRHPDWRDIERLNVGDTHRTGVKAQLEKASKYMEDYRTKHRRKVKEEIRDRTKDDKLQLANAFGKLANVSKCNSTFRRVTPKTKGKVFDRKLAG